MSNNWKLEGHYFESCTCDLVCPCIFLAPPTKGFCEAFVGWHISKGHLDDTDLSNLNVAAWLHAPGLLTDGGWNLALYIDENASEDQKAAITKIWGGEVGGHLAVIASLVKEVVSVKSAKIEINKTDTRREMKVSGAGEVMLNALEGEDGGAVVVSNHPLAVAPGNEIIVHKSENIEYHDQGKQWQHSDTVGLAANFQYQP